MARGASFLASWSQAWRQLAPLVEHGLRFVQALQAQQDARHVDAQAEALAATLQPLGVDESLAVMLERQGVVLLLHGEQAEAVLDGELRLVVVERLRTPPRRPR